MPSVDDLMADARKTIDAAQAVLDDSDWDDFYAFVYDVLNTSEAERQSQRQEDSDIQCRGCFILGTACGHCSRCWDAMRHPWARVPERIAVCPECSGDLRVVANAWVEETGQPIAEALQIECAHDEEDRHRWWQSDWQPVIDAVRKWCGASDE